MCEDFGKDKARPKVHTQIVQEKADRDKPLVSEVTFEGS